MKPDINAVEVHLHLSHKWHPVNGALVGTGLPMAEMGLLNKYALTNVKTVKHSFPIQMIKGEIRLVGQLSIQISERLLVNPCRLQNTLGGSSSLANKKPSKRAWFPNPLNTR